MKIKTFILFFLIYVFIISCAAGTVQKNESQEAQSKHFVREAKFPEGEQINSLIGGFFSGTKDVNVEEFTFSEPYTKVWNVCKKISDKFDKIGKRPVINTNEKTGRINIGKIEQDALIGAGGWLDEFLIEATEVSPNHTKVSVTRKVVERELDEKVDRVRRVKSYEHTWRTQWSNGKIERWLLTQIEDELSPKGALSTVMASQSNQDKKSISPSPIPLEEKKEKNISTGETVSSDATNKPTIEPEYLFVTKNVNMRVEANDKSKIIAKLKEGTKVEKLKVSGSWINVKLLTGTIGWIFKDYLKDKK